jgi:hypothetical protein
VIFYAHCNYFSLNNVRRFPKRHSLERNVFGKDKPMKSEVVRKKMKSEVIQHKRGKRD